VAQRQRSHGGRGSGDGVLLSVGPLWLTALGRGSKRSVRHGTCFHRRLSAHRAGAAPHFAVAELGSL